MKLVARAPFFVFFGSYFAGFFLYDFPLLISISILFILFIFSVLLIKVKVKTLLVYAFFVFIGGLSAFRVNHREQSILKSLNSLSSATVFIPLDLLKQEEKGDQWVCEVDRIRTQQTWQRSKEKILLKTQVELQEGKHYLSDLTFVSLKGSNHGQYFDYNNYLIEKGIRYKSTLKKAPVLLSQKSVFSIGTSINQSIKAFLESNFNHSSFEVLNALLLGNRESLSAKTKGVFIETGAMHLLAVSGLHVGAFFSLFYFFAMLSNSKRIKNAILVISILALWVFASVANFSPSVVRASFMLSIFVVSKIFRRDIKPINLISFSLFMMLVINPKLMYDVGFQLSFMAVVGIFYVYPFFENVKSSKKILNYFLQITLLSISIQISTLPIAFYNFHSFASYFILSNCISIPLTTLILYIGFFLSLTHYIYVLDFLVKLEEWLIQWQLTYLEFLSGMKNSYIEGIYFTISDVYIYYGILFSLIMLIYQKSKTWLCIFLVLLISFPVSQFVQHRLLEQEAFLLVMKNWSENYFFVKKGGIIFTNCEEKSITKNMMVLSQENRAQLTTIKGRKLRKNVFYTIDGMSIHVGENDSHTCDVFISKQGRCRFSKDDTGFELECDTLIRLQ